MKIGDIIADLGVSLFFPQILCFEKIIILYILIFTVATDDAVDRRPVKLHHDERVVKGRRYEIRSKREQNIFEGKKKKQDDQYS